MLSIIRLSLALWQEKRGEAVIYSMIATVTAAVLVGLVMFASDVDGSFQSVGDLIDSVRAGL